MVFGSIGTLIDKIKESVVEYFNGISEQVNTTIDLIRQDISGVSTKLDDVKSIIEKKDIGDEIQNLKQGVDKIEHGIYDGVQSELGNINSKLDNRFTEMTDDLSTLTKNVKEILERQDTELTNLRHEANEANLLRAQIKEKTEQLKQVDKELTETKNTLSIKDGELADKETELETLRQKFSDVQTELNAARQNSSSAEDALQAWQNAVADYAPVRTAMTNCDTFGKLLEERGLLGDSDIALLAFVQELGKTIDFLRDVHQNALEVKKTNPTPMTREEIAVYEALNKCYRRIWNIDFDVFVTPGERKSVGESYYKIPFNKDDAIVLKDPRNRSLKFVKEIYVPLLLNREGRMYKQSYVEATNL